MIIKSVNPTTEKVIKSYKCDTDNDIKSKVNNSRKAFFEWKELGIKERCNYLRKVAQVIKKRKEEFGKLITT
ncbi:MAG: aldehyde dehydrogenase family protein, partial [Nanoarchaeota archaeon]